jgi:hypothetical protein
MRNSIRNGGGDSGLAIAAAASGLVEGRPAGEQCVYENAIDAGGVEASHGV